MVTEAGHYAVYHRRMLPSVVKMLWHYLQGQLHLVDKIFLRAFLIEDLWYLLLFLSCGNSWTEAQGSARFSRASNTKQVPKKTGPEMSSHYQPAFETWKPTLDSNLLRNFLFPAKVVPAEYKLKYPLHIYQSKGCPSSSVRWSSFQNSWNCSSSSPTETGQSWNL